MYLWIILLLINYVQAQQDMCSCSCCIGVLCTPSYFGTGHVPSCTLETCRTYCRNSFYQCQTDYPNGRLESQCSPSTTAPSFGCKCDCCKTGTTSCTPVFVGYSTAYACQPGLCSISCAGQYPNQCVADATGLTVGECTGPITTTTTTTTTTTSVYALGNTCSCTCCQSGPNCIPNIVVGNTTAVQCSSAACIAACQTQYSSQCPSLPNLGQTNGVCINQNTHRCGCQCCGTSGCLSYELPTNIGCTSCNTLCQERCGTTVGVTATCDSNRTNKSIQFSFPLIIFIIIFILPFSSTF